MCGIIAVTGGLPESQLEQLLDSIAHRGPDGRGRAHLTGCSLGMVRLAILDPHARSNQPMRSGTKHLVYNGELYNFRELRRELKTAGLEFLTEGDTEVVLAALGHWGLDACKRFRGMFAFALWDETTQELWLGRDRYGIKPLYWCSTGDGHVAAASEVQALNRLHPRPVRQEALAEFLRYGSVLTGTIRAGVQELAPGTLLVVSDDALRTVRYADDTADASRDAPTGTVTEDPVRLLQWATVQHLTSDRPLAVFLSGGFDSTALLSAARLAGERPLALTLSTGRNASDLEGALRSTAHYGVEHHVIEVPRPELPAKVDSFVRSMDQPTIDGFNVYLMCEAARERDRPVVLSGLGGDEVLGGYSYYRHQTMISMMTRVWPVLPSSLQVASARALARLTGRPERRIAGVLAATDVVERYQAWRTLFADDEVSSLLPGTNVAPPYTGVLPLGTLRQQLAALDFELYLRPTLLRDADVFSMCHGVELRVPFLDSVFVEAALRAEHPPTKLELAKAWGDVHLQEIAKEAKQTFRIPWEDWLPLVTSDSAASTAQHDASDKVLNKTFVKEVLQRCGATRDDPSRPWSLYVLERWLAHHASDDVGVTA